MPAIRGPRRASASSACTGSGTQLYFAGYQLERSLGICDPLEPAVRRDIDLPAAALALFLSLLGGANPGAISRWGSRTPLPRLAGVVAAALITGDRLTIELLVASVAVAVGIGLTSK